MLPLGLELVGDCIDDSSRASADMELILTVFKCCRIRMQRQDEGCCHTMSLVVSNASCKHTASVCVLTTPSRAEVAQLVIDHRFWKLSTAAKLRTSGKWCLQEPFDTYKRHASASASAIASLRISERWKLHR